MEVLVPWGKFFTLTGIYSINSSRRHNLCIETDINVLLLYRFSQPIASTEIWLDDVSCSSSDLTLLDCRHRGIGVENCVHSQDVALICETAGTITSSDSSE